MEEKKLVPKRRFKGYYKDWLELSLKDFRDESDIYSYTGGPFGSDLKTEDYTKTGVRIIQLQNIGDGFFSNSYKIYTSEEKAESLSSNLIFPDDIIIAKMAEPLARAAIIPQYEEKYLMASDGIRLKVDKKRFNNYFILTLINHDKFRNKALENSTGTTRKRIGLVTLGNLRSYVPEYDEQQKIGEFFKVLDQRIANQERKITKVKALKSAYLNEMLPQKGENVPKRRFKGYTEKWNYCLLKEVINSEFKGKAKAEMQGGNSPYLDTNYLNGGEISYVNLPNDVEKDDVLILWDGSQAGMVYHGFEGALGSTLKAYKPKYSGEFLYQFLKKNQKVIFEQYRTPNIPHVINTFVDEFWICMPSIEEQQKIGQFFKNLDDQIAIEEKKLEKLKQMKEAYLEEMFV